MKNILKKNNMAKKILKEKSIEETLWESANKLRGCGRGGISTGGGGSTNELTNWDGTKKQTGWGI